MPIHTARSPFQVQGKLFRGFADPSRLALLHYLCAAPCTVSHLVALTGLTQSNVSNHLACLRDCGLITATTQGRWTVYALSDARIATLLQLADTLVHEVAYGVADCVNYEVGTYDSHD